MPNALVIATLLSRGSPSQLTLLVNQIVHTYIQPITNLVVGFFSQSIRVLIVTVSSRIMPIAVIVFGAYEL
ncbi:hypothetical protein DSB67_24765 [Vibrio campbellii]|nr:hypothetical protein DSB67_24765 [Vibrio campbellii]